MVLQVGAGAPSATALVTPSLAAPVAETPQATLPVYTYSVDVDKCIFPMVEDGSRVPRYKVISLIGKGTQSRVFQVEMIASKEVFAVKCNRPPEMDEFHKAHYVDLCREARMLKAMQAIVYIPRYFEAFDVNVREGVLVLEKLNCPDLYTTYSLGFKNGLPRFHVLSITMQILFALKSFKELGIVHTDIKPENTNLDTSSMKVKVIDFGQALNISILQKIAEKYEMQTTLYRSPEVILKPKDHTYDYAIDMWSTGILLSEVVLGKRATPWPLAELKGIPEEHVQMANIAKLRGMPPETWLNSSAVAHHCFKKRDDGIHVLSLPGEPAYRPTDSLAEQLKNKALTHWRNPEWEKDKNPPEFIAEAEDFADLISQMTSYENRITPEEAIEHPLFNNYLFWEVAMKQSESVPFNSIAFFVKGEKYFQIDLEKYPEKHWFLPKFNPDLSCSVFLYMKNGKFMESEECRISDRARILIDEAGFHHVDLRKLDPVSLPPPAASPATLPTGTTSPLVAEVSTTCSSSLVTPLPVKPVLPSFPTDSAATATATATATVSSSSSSKDPKVLSLLRGKPEDAAIAPAAASAFAVPSQSRRSTRKRASVTLESERRSPIVDSEEDAIVRADKRAKKMPQDDVPAS